MLHIATLDHFKEWLDALTPLNDIEVHFLDNNIISIKMTDTSNAILNRITYKTEIHQQTSGKINLTPVKAIKSPSIEIHLDGNQFIFKKGATKYKCTLLADPKVTTRDITEKKFQTTEFTITKDQVKELVEIISNDKKYFFGMANHKFTILDLDNTVEHEIEITAPDKHLATFHGQLLEDVFKVYKHFDNLTIGLGTDCPVTLLYTNDYLTVEYWVSPIIDR